MTATIDPPVNQPNKAPEPPPTEPRFSAKRSRVPTILQMEAVECGAASLAMVLAHYGRWVPLEELREACNVSRDGADAANVLRAARQYGLEAKGMRSEIPDLSGFSMPAIIFWDFRHFVVLEGSSRKGAWINDPSGGPRLVPWTEFDLSFTGVSLVFRPGPNFERRGSAPSLLRALSARLRGARAALVLCVLAGLGLILPGLTLPVILRVFVDRVLTPGTGGDGTVPVLVVALLAAAAVAIALSWLQQATLVRLSTKLAISMSVRFFDHLLKLPLVFFQQRYAGTLVTRTNVNDQVAMLLSSQFATALLQTMTVTFYAVLMFVYSADLAAVTVGLALINLLVLRSIARRRTDANRRLVLDSAKMTSTAMGALQNIETIKAIGEEGGIFARWAGQQAKVANARRELGRPTVLIDALPTWLTTLNTVFIVGFGSYRVLEGSLSLGTLAAFQVLASNFSAPIGQLVGLGGTIQEMTGKIASVDDVLDYAEDPELEALCEGAHGRHRADDAWGGHLDHARFGGAQPVLLPPRLAPGQEAQPTACAGRLTGRVELRNVTFGYDRGKDPLIEGLSLTITPGQRVAIIGASGSGKSTVAKLVCGLTQPWSGQILLDGVPRQQIDRRVLASSLALVDQDIVLFESTVRDNMTLWNPTIGQHVLAQAARDAEIHADVLSRPGGFDRVVEEAGRDWSGGQRQRMEIARALATDPTIVVLDEATSALDAIVEARIDANLRGRGCTCIIVAHRLSTIRDADQIVVMDNGKVVEQGTHADLMAAGGKYTKLVGE